MALIRFHRFLNTCSAPTNAFLAVHIFDYDCRTQAHHWTVGHGSQMYNICSDSSKSCINKTTTYRWPDIEKVAFMRSRSFIVPYGTLCGCTAYLWACQTVQQSEVVRTSYKLLPHEIPVCSKQRKMLRHHGNLNKNENRVLDIISFMHHPYDLHHYLNSFPGRFGSWNPEPISSREPEARKSETIPTMLY